MSGNNLNAVDAGTIICIIAIEGEDIDYTSKPFTLRISGEQLVYFACIVYCKQYIIRCCLNR